MLNILKKKFPGTLSAIWSKTWTDFWGQIKPTLLQDGQRFLNEIFSCYSFFANVCKKKKKRSLSFFGEKTLKF